MTIKIPTTTYWEAGPFNFFYVLVQQLIIWLFKPPPPPLPRRAAGFYGFYLSNMILLQPLPPSTPLSRYVNGRIAVIGAGPTGVACAVHAITHGFDVVIYEQTCTVGGIWATVSKTSGLRIPSCFYRFHPGVLWSCAFPQRDEILRETRRIFEEYRLEPHTRFGSRVTSVNRVKGSSFFQEIAGSEEARPTKWTIDNGADGEFDAVVLALGTRGAPKPPDIPGLSPAERSNRYPDGVKVVKVVEGSGPGEEFEGEVVHSSRFRQVRRLEEETVLVIGNNAGGVDAVETALANGAKRCIMVARDDKWIIRQNLLNTTLIALQRFVRQKRFSFMLEEIIKMANYRGAPQLVPARRLKIFEDTPIISDEFVKFVKQGRCEYVRGEVDCLTRQGVRVRVRDRDEMPGEGKRTSEYEGNVLVFTTGFSKPKMAFVESEPFPEGYEDPHLYLGSFSTEDWSVVSMNPGIVGHWRVGINMRILLTFLMYRHARPTSKDMKAWVDNVRYYHQHIMARWKSSFWNYVELVIWLYFYVSRIHRLKWVFFVMQGWGEL